VPERITFTPRAADRIARAVRKVEAGDRKNAGLAFAVPPASASQEKTFRVCTFTGSWSINDTKTVTFRNQTSTPNTVAAVNLFLSLPDNGTRNCAIAKDGTAWHLIQWQWDTSTAVSTVTLGTAALEFTRINVASLGTAGTASIALQTETVVSSVVLTDTQLEFSRKSVSVLASSTAGTASIALQTETVVSSVVLTDTQLEFSRKSVSVLASSTAGTASIALQTEEVVSGVTLTASQLEFSRRGVKVLLSGTASTVSIAISTCGTATASP
jgi:hypothetical protein